MRNILKGLKGNFFTIFVILFFLLLIATITIVSYKFIYLPYSNAFSGVTPNAKNTSDIRAAWGQLGDYFGGTLNPIFGFSSFVALLITILYQAKELNASTKELKNSATALAAQNKAIELQSFEQTFFSWLNTYRDLLNAISGNLHNKSLEGRNYLFSAWKNELSESQISQTMFKRNNFGEISNQPKDQFAGNYDSLDNTSSYNRVKTIAEQNPQECYNHILIIWTQLYRDNEYQLDSLFRTLYRLLVWIDSQQVGRLNDAQKWLYVSIVRSQLSWIEMAYLYYNGLTPVGFKFKFLIEKYALFDNLTVEQDVGLWVLNRHAPEKAGYKTQAFNSEEARKELGLPKTSEDTLALATAVSNPSAAPEA